MLNFLSCDSRNSIGNEIRRKKAALLANNNHLIPSRGCFEHPQNIMKRIMLKSGLNLIGLENKF